ncbi:MAG: reverse transcriptase-like protein, partial [Actinomycetes bacterium]|nr:reverse transcriptase-like protein [Actinomycetes bacterium]
MDRYILKTDGGSRGNPGPAGIGFVLTKNDEIICRGGTYIGETTNNVAEYHALIWGLENALDYEVGELSIRADSELVVRQINGSYKVKHPQLKLLFLQARSLLRQLNRYDIAHVPRGENANADALANEAMDARAQVGEPCKAYVIVADDAPTPDTPDIAEGSYHLSVKEHFDAAHHLYDYPGQCRNLHGHTWEVEVTVSGTR